jgi:hypothetical protein
VPQYKRLNRERAVRAHDPACACACGSQNSEQMNRQGQRAGGNSPYLSSASDAGNEDGAALLHETDGALLIGIERRIRHTCRRVPVHCTLSQTLFRVRSIVPLQLLERWS